MAIYIGLDIGGTKFLAAAADARGEIIRTAPRRETPLDLDDGLALLNMMIAEVKGDEPIAGIGAAIGGPIDWKSGVVSPLHQPAWRKIPLKAIMEKRWSCPFFIDVDTNIAAVGEYEANPSKPERLLYLTISTGMGGGFLINGKIYRGMNGEHPEVGHQSIPYRCSHPEAIFCECEVPDCLEALVSGNAIRRIYGKPAQDLLEEEWTEVTFNIAQGLRNLIAIYLPDEIVLGGGVAIGRGDRLIVDLKQILTKYLKIVPFPRIRLSRLGNETALRGAIVTAIRGLN